MGRALNKPEYKFSVVLGTTDEQAARRLLPNMHIRGMKRMEEAVMDVQAGYGQAMVSAGFLQETATAASAMPGVLVAALSVQP